MKYGEILPILQMKLSVRVNKLSKVQIVSDMNWI